MAVPVSFYVPSSSVVVAVLRPRPRSCPPAAGEDAQVGPPEGGVAQRVQHRVDGGVDVAEVVGEVPKRLGDPLFQLQPFQNRQHAAMQMMKLNFTILEIGLENLSF